MSGHFRSYSAARSIFSFMEFMGWIVVVVGLFLGMALSNSVGRYASDIQHILMFAIGGSGSLVGLFFVGAVQSWRAGVDAAEYSQQALNVARLQLDVSEQSLKLQSEEAKTFASMQTAAKAENAISYGKNTSQENLANPNPNSTTENVLDEPVGAEQDAEQIEVDTAETSNDQNPLIEEKDGKFHLGTMSFLTRDAAEEYASHSAANPKLET